MVDRNLFLYDLAVVAIMKDEGRYLREWLDYHLLAGVEHFYLYDNDSTDNQREVAAPYVAAGLVDYIPALGKLMQMPAYNDAVKNFRFRCRYMAFIDSDEFIFPKDGRSIAEVVDEILSHDENAAGASFHWQFFGSNGQKAADYSRGVLERFTRRAPIDHDLNKFVKTIADPRKIRYFQTMHFPYLFEPLRIVNEQQKSIGDNVSLPIVADKMAINHYYTKSKAEYEATKVRRGWPCSGKNPYDDEQFLQHDRNEVFDDGILRYRVGRAENFTAESDERRLERVQGALTEKLSSAAAGKAIDLETALTLRAASSYLRGRFPDSNYWRLCEEASVAAILKSLDKITLVEAQLFVHELPNVLCLPYPAVADVRKVAEQVISPLMELARIKSEWLHYTDLSRLLDLLKLGE